MVLNDLCCLLHLFPCKAKLNTLIEMLSIGAFFLVKNYDLYNAHYIKGIKRKYFLYHFKVVFYIIGVPRQVFFFSVSLS